MVLCSVLLEFGSWYTNCCLVFCCCMCSFLVQKTFFCSLNTGIRVIIISLAPCFFFYWHFFLKQTDLNQIEIWSHNSNNQNTMFATLTANRREDGRVQTCRKMRSYVLFKPEMNAVVFHDYPGCFICCFFLCFCLEWWIVLVNNQVVVFFVNISYCFGMWRQNDNKM